MKDELTVEMLREAQKEFNEQSLGRVEWVSLPYEQLIKMLDAAVADGRRESQHG